MPPSCPSDESLSDYLLGRTPAGTTRAIEHHLDECPACPARLGRLHVDSRLTQVLAGSTSAGPPTTGGTGLSHLITRLVGLVPDSRSAAGATSGVDEDDAGFPFLGQPAAPGELGRLAGYRVVRLIGRGGMGYVFRAVDEQLGRAVGLKVLRPKANRDQSARSRFLHEARAMAAVRHDHIVVVYQVGEAAAGDPGSPAVAPPGGPGTAFLAMELLDGLSLQAWMRANRRPPVAVAVRIAREATAGLAAAHARGLIHRDVKPSNLWLQAPPEWDNDPPADPAALGVAGRVKVIDFGLAGPVDDADLASGCGGTPAYMAPEQFAGRPPDARSDLFALGCVLYELCTGEHPFPGRARGRPGDPDPDPTPARDLNPAVPTALSRLIGRLLAADPAARPATAADLARELAEIGEPPARPDGRGYRAAAVILAAGVLGAGVFLVVGRTRPHPPPPSDVAVSPPPAVAGSPPTVSTTPVWPEPPADRPPFPAGPPDEWWCRTTAEQPSQEQYRLVAHKLAEVNPGFDPLAVTGWIEPELVIRFTVKADEITDLRPVRGLPELKTLTIEGVSPGGGRLTDLGPVAGLPLVFLNVRNNPDLRDLEPLRGMGLERLSLTDTGVASLAPLAGSPIRLLDVSGCPVTDLRPVATLPELVTFRCVGCPVESFEPLAGRPIVHLCADLDPARDAAFLKRLPKLRTLNGRPFGDN